MSEIVWGLLAFFVRAIDFVLDIALLVCRMRELARMWTGSDKVVEVPATVKILTPSAQRALAEAGQRNHFLYLPRKQHRALCIDEIGRDFRFVLNTI